jgi:type VI secretion system protein ImpH
MPNVLGNGTTPQRFELFALMRGLECRHPAQPRLGEALRPRDEAIRFGQHPDPGFAPGEVAHQPAVRHGQRPHLAIAAFGLTGPRGPLPSALSEYIHQRARQENDHGWSAFLDVFQHRLTCLYYRAWAAGQPVIGADRPHDDPLARLLSACSGHESLGLSDAESRARLFFAGLLCGHSRPAAGLAKILGGYFGVPARVEPFIGTWLTVEPEDCTRLGQSRISLGQGCMVGTRAWSRQHRFRLTLGPLGATDTARFLPEGRSFVALQRWVNDYCAGRLEWQLELQPAPDACPPARLGASARIGRSCWLGRPQAPCLRISPDRTQRTPHG